MRVCYTVVNFIGTIQVFVKGIEKIKVIVVFKI